ncbi:hypothetical protein H9L05_13200 [Hymenobacter qilianensis]|uniref:Tetratricopeptide repeat protein n=1 Tax=Hymenobacter qilianensis TaxID=1385715 RepID=A0A7H0GS03_9BACT|nr:hypothetical protein [Hymenobacter qilianensis]QNP51069.1 hypothetical protein H9L05_13200 [Hymenobacter qilianensis]
MKTFIFLLAFVAASFSATAQQTAAPAGYTDMMAATIMELNSTGDPAQLRQLVSKFERAATAAPTDWLPAYYQAYGLLITAFQSKEDGDTKDEYLDQAEAALAQARKLRGDESELLVLQGYIYQARLGISPMDRSGKYSRMVSEVLGQAKGINPANPRIYLVLGNNVYFTPKMFGAALRLLSHFLRKRKPGLLLFSPAAR